MRVTQTNLAETAAVDERPETTAVTDVPTSR
jgi:hypothetical protein